MQAESLAARLIIPPLLRGIASPHRAMLEAAFGPLRPQPGFVAPPGQVLLLCFTNRCGSNYLAQILAGTGAFNEAGEFFNGPTVMEHAAARGLRSLPAYVGALPDLLPRRKVLAAKAGVDQLVMLADAGVLDAWGNRATYLLLERQDRLGQAISRVIASQNGLWTTAHIAPAPVGALRYDRAAIEAELDKIARANAAFYLFFAANGVVPVHVTYESVLANPQAVLDEVAARIALPALQARLKSVSIRKQADGVNADWRRRYARGD